MKNKSIVLKNRSEIASISNNNDPNVLLVRIPEDGIGLNISYGNRWLQLKDGEITEVKVHVKESDGKREHIINEPIKQI